MTDSKIEAQSDPHPCNNSSLEQFGPHNKCQSDHANDVEQSEDNNNSHPTNLEEPTK